MWISFSAFPQLFKNHIKKEEGRKPSRILGFQPKTMCKERNSSTMLKWDEVKDCNGTNLHLFDAVQVITSDNRRKNQTGRILSLLKTKPHLHMVEVLFEDGERVNFLTSSLRFGESLEDEKGKALSKIDYPKLMGAEITDSDFCVVRYNNDAFQFDAEKQSWNVMLEDLSDVDRLFGTFFETEQNDSYCNIYADVNKHCTQLTKPYLTVSLWFGDYCVEAVRHLIRKAGDNSRHERNRFKTEICRCDRYVYFSRTHRTDKHITVKKDADRKKRVQQKCAKPCLECCSCKFVAVVLENTIQHRVQRNYQKCLKSFVYQVEPFHVSDDINRTALHSFGYQ